MREGNLYRTKTCVYHILLEEKPAHNKDTGHNIMCSHSRRDVLLPTCRNSRARSFPVSAAKSDAGDDWDAFFGLAEGMFLSRDPAPPSACCCCCYCCCCCCCRHRRYCCWYGSSPRISASQTTDPGGAKNTKEAAGGSSFETADKSRFMLELGYVVAPRCGIINMDNFLAVVFSQECGECYYMRAAISLRSTCSADQAAHLWRFIRALPRDI